jgi:lipopolysaccharide export system permease protein
MLGLKKIDAYLLKRFLTLFVMTFLICIFILLMQFLWKHFAELIGKGIGIEVLAEFFIYAVASLVPLALPLAILLASLMTFGNLGENFELIAMKSAGISLFRIMRPLIIFISFICIGAFYFSNNILPVSQKKLWTLILSLRQKSPEFKIPVGEFYNGIGTGVSLYVREKDDKVLKKLMIYDYSKGFENATVMTADSGRILFTADDKYLKLVLYEGESFENLKDQSISGSPSSIPYRRENFKMKEFLFDFNNQFNRFDDSFLQDQNLSKNLVQLTASIDSVNKEVYKRGHDQGKEMLRAHFFCKESTSPVIPDSQTVLKNPNIDADSLFLSLTQRDMEVAASYSIDRTKTMKDMIIYNKTMMDEPIKYVIRHEIERHRKFTLSFACLIFFFIGAPLGAIIRKGGLGMPVVISVVMFIFYYIIDNTGYKMAREAVWTTFEGMWLSSSVLLPIGIFITYKAATDATLFEAEHYLKIWGYMKNKFKQFSKTKIANT